MSEKKGFWVIASKTGEPIMYWSGGTYTFSSSRDDAVKFSADDLAEAERATWPEPMRDAYVVAFSVIDPPMVE